MNNHCFPGCECFKCGLRQHVQGQKMEESYGKDIALAQTLQCIITKILIEIRMEGEKHEER